MQHKLTSIAAFAAAVALSSPAFAAEDQPSSLNYRSSLQGETKTVQGRLMTLYDFLSQGSHGSSQTPGATKPSDTTGVNRQSDLGQRDADPAARAAERNRDRTDRSDRTDSNQPDRSTQTQPDRSAQTQADQNRPQGSDNFGADRDRNRTGASPGATPPAAGGTGMSVQPLVLVADAGAGSSSTFREGLGTTAAQRAQDQSDATRRDPATERDSATPNQADRSITEPGRTPSSITQGTTPGTTARSMSGDAYVLVFNPQNYASRMALSQAHGMVPQSGLYSRSSESGNNRPDTERLEVRGQDDPSDPGRAQATGQQSWMKAGQKVTVKGKVLSRGGIQALEVTSIEKSTE